MFVDAELGSVLYLGLCFTVLFSSDFTVINMQKTITNSISEDNPEYTIDGYVSLGLVYSVYGLCLWLAPPIVQTIGPKLGLVTGSLGYVILVYSFLLESSLATYIGMVLGGIGGSILWVSEANYIVLSSTKNTLGRNVAIFWVLFTTSLIFGNLYAVVELEGKSRIDGGTRTTLLHVLGAVAIVSTLMFCLLPRLSGNRFVGSQDDRPSPGVLTSLRKTWTIFCRKELLILIVTFLYSGFQQSFGQGIYAPCIGFTKQFGTQAKQLVPLSGLIYGSGDLIGGALQTLMSRFVKYMKWWSSFTILFGFMIQVTAYILIYLNIPNNSVFGETDDYAIFKRSSIPIAMACSFLIGFGDSCINTQMYPLLAALEPDFSAQTSALYKFTKSMGMAVCFFSSGQLGLHLQLGIVMGTGVLGTAAFLWVNSNINPDSSQIKA